MRKKCINLISIVLVFCLSTFNVAAFASTNAAKNISIRYGGDNRYETSLNIVKAGWKSADTVVLVTGESSADALCAAPLAKAYNAPIILINPKGQNSDVLNYLSSLGTKNAFIIGGTGVIPQTIEDLIKSKGISTNRIFGNDRYATSLKIAEQVEEKLGTITEAVLANGSDESFADALSISSIAAYRGMPILLTKKDNLPDGVTSFLSSKEIKNTFIIGGNGVISDSVKNLIPNSKVLSGNDRYSTNVAVMKAFSDLSFNKVYIATGKGYADALAGSVLAAVTSSPIVLVNSNIPYDTKEFLKDSMSVNSSIVVLGGTAVVPDNIVTDLEKVIKAIADQQTQIPIGGGSGSYTPPEYHDHSLDFVPNEPGEVQVTVKPLVIAMDFTDYNHEDIDDKEDWRINNFEGKDCTPELYNNMFFGEDFYKGSDEGSYISINKFIKEESRGTVEVKGGVHGWYPASREAAYYGSNEDWKEQNRTCDLVREALDAVAKDPNINLADYDVEDPYDYNNNGNYFEPDGEIDCIVVIHPGLGEEFGGGSLGEDAIWPFRSALTWYDNNPKHEVTDTKGNKLKADNFLAIEQDIPVDLFAHEYGHYLGLPDLYGRGQVPVEYWSLMGGSYTGSLRGSKPNSYGAFCKDLLQEIFDKKGVKTNWQKKETLNLADINENGVDVILDQATLNGKNNSALRIDLPDRTDQIIDYKSNAYYSGIKNSANESAITSIDLLNIPKGSEIKLEFDTWYDIEQDWDYASVQVKDSKEGGFVSISGNITTTDNPNDDTPNDLTDRNPGYGITGKSNEWIKAEFDLSQYAGRSISLKFYFWSDTNTPNTGIFIDNIKVTAKVLPGDAEGDSKPEPVEIVPNEQEVLSDNAEVDSKPDPIEVTPSDKDVLPDDTEEDSKLDSIEATPIEKVIFFDDAEGNPKFDLDGFTVSVNGERTYKHYYMLEWRNYDNGLVDKGLYDVTSFWEELKYDPGLIIWYVNEKFGDPRDSKGRPDQAVVDHPGYCSVGIVDADQEPISYKDEHTLPWLEYVTYQMHDAAFSLKDSSAFTKVWGNAYVTKDPSTNMIPVFDDSLKYDSPSGHECGLNLASYGLKIFVTAENKDRSVAKIHIMKGTKNDAAPIYDSDVLNSIKIKNTYIQDGYIYVDTEGNLADTAKMTYVTTMDRIYGDGSVKTIHFNNEINLTRTAGGLYRAKIADSFSAMDLPYGEWKPGFIVLSDKDGNTKAFYNMHANYGYGMDLSNLNVNKK